MGELREAVYRAIEELSPPDWSFVFTNVVVKAFVATEELLRPQTEILDLDVTDLAPDDSASQIEDYLGLAPR